MTEEALVESEKRDLDGDFRMTEEEFDRVLKDCSRARGNRPSGLSPPCKEAKKVSTTQSQSKGRDRHN